MMWLARLIARHPRTVLVVGIIVTSIAVISASHLQLRTDLADLLPSKSSSAADYRTFLSVFGGLEKVFVVVRPPLGGDDETAASVTEAAVALAALLSDSPEVALAKAGVSTEDEEFFLKYVVPRALLLSGGNWRGILEDILRPEFLRERAATIRSKVISPTSALEVPILAADPFGLVNEVPGFRFLSSSLPVDPVTLTFLSEDGEASLVIVTPARSEIDPSGGRALVEDLEAAFSEVRANLGLEFRFDAVGGPLYAAADEELIRNDLKRTVSGSAVGCLLFLVAAFGGIALPSILLITVLFALALTGGLIAGLFHGISAISLGFAAVLVGLGIDYGIHAATRYRQSRMDGLSREDSLVATYRGAGPGILTSALTTAAAFGVLMFAHLRPVRELGVLVTCGILSMLVMTVTVGAAALVLWKGPSKRAEGGGALWRWIGASVDFCVSIGTRYPFAVLAVTVCVVVVSAAGIPRLRFESDLRAVRPIDHPAMEAERLLVEYFDVGVGTVTFVVPGNDLGDALESCARVRAALQMELGDGADITSPADWLGVPSTIQDRLRVLEEFSMQPGISVFEAELVKSGLNPHGFSVGLNALRDLDEGRDPAPLDRANWPTWVKELVSVEDDRTWVMMRLRLPGEVWQDGPPAEFVTSIKSAVPGIAVASIPAVGRDLRNLAKSDLRRLSWIALFVVFTVVILSFRGSVYDSFIALTPVVVGSVCLLGVWGFLGHPIDLITLVVLPILLGIGIDDGLHAVHGTRGASPLPLADAVSISGRAMTLTTLTTCVGFGSLTLSHVPGLRNGGVLVAAGVVACLIATLVVLPAWDRAASMIRRR
jgi:predicted RND superfamily exporter protein